MRWLSLVLATAACATGLVAARLWRKSSQVKIDSGWRPPGTDGPIEPNGEGAHAIGWSAATVQAFNAVVDLNRKAALWTAVSVTLSALTAFYAAMSP